MFASAMRDVLKRGYTLKDLGVDALAGLTVSVIALPIAMALAVASGALPQQGLYTAILAGFCIALLGGSRLSVAGPTAAFVAILYPIIERHGFEGLLLATAMAGVVLVGMGFAKFGRFVQFIPYPVTTGFTAGIGVAIITLQLKDLLGLAISKQPAEFLERCGVLWSALPTFRVSECITGGVTIALLVGWSKLRTRLPAHLVAMLGATLVAALLSLLHPEWQVETIGDRFGAVSSTLPSFNWPFGNVTMEAIRNLLGPAFAIAMLCAMESLMCATVLDGMAGTRHDSNGELIAQGVGNLLVSVTGGLTATSALARSVTNFQSGARSPLAAVFHSIFILLAVLFFAPWLSYLPMSALAALLLVVAWNISDLKHFVHIVFVAPGSDVAVLLVCFTLTVLFDMVISVGVGTVLAALLFMKEMANITGGKWLLADKPSAIDESLPNGVMLYEISGPLFFGATEKAMNSLRNVQSHIQVVILHMGNVPTMDMSGLVALQSAVRKLQLQSIFLIVTNIPKQPQHVLQRAGVRPIENQMVFTANVQEAIDIAKTYLEKKYPSLPLESIPSTSIASIIETVS